MGKLLRIIINIQMWSRRSKKNGGRKGWREMWPQKKGERDAVLLDLKIEKGAMSL